MESCQYGTAALKASRLLGMNVLHFHTTVDMVIISVHIVYVAVPL